jgi:hypothetical protein
MGHNRAGVRRRARLKRRRREMEHLAEKAARAGEGGAREAGAESHGLLGAVKDVAKGVAQTVGGLLRGRSEKKETPPPEVQS